ERAPRHTVGLGLRLSVGAEGAVSGLTTWTRFAATLRGAPMNLAPTSFAERHTTWQLASRPSISIMSSNVSGTLRELSTRSRAPVSEMSRTVQLAVRCRLLVAMMPDLSTRRRGDRRASCWSGLTSALLIDRNWTTVFCGVSIVSAGSVIRLTLSQAPDTCVNGPGPAPSFRILVKCRLAPYRRRPGLCLAGRASGPDQAAGHQWQASVAIVPVPAVSVGVRPVPAQVGSGAWRHRAYDRNGEERAEHDAGNDGAVVRPAHPGTAVPVGSAGPSRRSAPCRCATPPGRPAPARIGVVRAGGMSLADGRSAARAKLDWLDLSGGPG